MGDNVNILVVNAGSSSLKLRLVDDDDAVLGSVDLAADAGQVPDVELERCLGSIGPADAVGHRVVHGGTRYTSAVVIDDDTLAALDALTELAPLHQPAAIELIRAVRRLRPATPAVACLDTGFHATLPPEAFTYPVPAVWRKRFGLRRFGFHGLSHAWASRRVAALVGRSDVRLVTCHLGAGASLAAVRSGVSVDTTMGFTPLDGLVMATRPGALDPGLVLWLAADGRVAVDELEDQLNHGAGLRALAGTGDMKAVVDRAEAGEPDAVLALDVYLHRLRASIAAMAAAMGGVDALVFTGGVGERSAVVRRRAADGLGFLGVAVDAAANEAAVPDAEIGAPGAAVRTFAVAAREDLEIARLTRHALAPPPG
jgi:acetate kinase